MDWSFVQRTNTLRNITARALLSYAISLSLSIISIRNASRGERVSRPIWKALTPGARTAVAIVFVGTNGDGSRSELAARCARAGSAAGWRLPAGAP